VREAVPPHRGGMPAEVQAVYTKKLRAGIENPGRQELEGGLARMTEQGTMIKQWHMHHESMPPMTAAGRQGGAGKDRLITRDMPYT